MNMLHWIEAHQVISTVIIYWVFSAAVSNMPKPSETGDGFYHWFYGFSHDILQFAAGSIMRIPGIRQFMQTDAQNLDEASKKAD